MCTQFPERLSSHPVVYAVDVVIVPVVFGFGLFGGLLSMIVFNRARLRKESAVYVYLVGITALDMVSLLSVTPKALQDTEVARPSVTYSKLMAHLTTASYAISNISKHASTWLMCILPIIAYQCSKYRYTKIRWTKISTSRLVVFLVVLFCAVIDFPRFLEVEVTEVEGHCFQGLELWFWRYTDFGSSNLFTVVYPMAVIVLCFALPYIGMILFSLVLLAHVKPGQNQKQKIGVCLYTPANPDEVEQQLSTLVLVVSLVFFLLNLPDTIVQVFVALYGNNFRKTQGFYEFAVIAQLLFLLRCSINFLLFSLLGSEFRKTFLRSFCCFCIEDEYYEPITCKTLCCCCLSNGEDTFMSSGETKRPKKRGFFSLSKKKNKDDSSGWL